MEKDSSREGEVGGGSVPNKQHRNCSFFFVGFQVQFVSKVAVICNHEFVRIINTIGNGSVEFAEECRKMDE